MAVACGAGIGARHPVKFAEYFKNMVEQMSW